MQNPGLFKVPWHMQANDSGQVATISPLALYDAMNDINNKRDQQFAAQNLTQTNGWGGGAGILGAALGGLLSGKFRREANAMENDYAKQAFLYEQQQHRLAQEAKADAKNLEREQELEDDILSHERAMEIATAKANAPTTKMREAASMGLQPNSPEYAKFMNSGGQTINVGSGKYGKIPEGYVLIETPDGVQMVPGERFASRKRVASWAIKRCDERFSCISG